MCLRRVHFVEKSKEIPRNKLKMHKEQNDPILSMTIHIIYYSEQYRYWSSLRVNCCHSAALTCIDVRGWLNRFTETIMNIVVVLLYANVEQFNICSGVTLAAGLWLHTGSAAHRSHRNSVQWESGQAEGCFPHEAIVSYIYLFIYYRPRNHTRVQS